MSAFLIEGLSHARGAQRVFTAVPFRLALAVVDLDLEGGDCAVRLAVSPAACAVRPATVVVAVPEGDAAGQAEVEVVIEGPAGTLARLVATPAGGSPRSLSLLLAEAPHG